MNKKNDIYTYPIPQWLEIYSKGSYKERIQYIDKYLLNKPRELITILDEETSYSVLTYIYPVLLENHIYPNIKTYEKYKDVLIFIAEENAHIEAFDLIYLVQDNKKYPLLMRTLAKKYYSYFNRKDSLSKTFLLLWFIKCVLAFMGEIITQSSNSVENMEMAFFTGNKYDVRKYYPYPLGKWLIKKDLATYVIDNAVNEKISLSKTMSIQDGVLFINSCSKIITDTMKSEEFFQAMFNYD